ncbi:DUF1127 domain-containing protein, partial [Bradyrhizobium sp. Arg68]|uniref:DUF1127 domain-containing protein n=1 Tax=Bradyrhizobium ivorense TaxID=2511166 RepID=UPI001E2A508B
MLVILAIVRRFEAWCKWFAAYRFRGDSVTRLSELDDRALLDIGIERSELEAAVYGL